MHRYAAWSGGREMLEHEYVLQEGFPLGGVDEDDFEGASLEELKAFRRYLKKSKMQKKKLYAAG